jgi:excinuclease ABC subunit B
MDCNHEHGLVLRTIKKLIREKAVEIADIRHIPKSDIPNLTIELESEKAVQLHDIARRLDKEIKI